MKQHTRVSFVFFRIYKFQHYLFLLQRNLLVVLLFVKRSLCGVFFSYFLMQLARFFIGLILLFIQLLLCVIQLVLLLIGCFLLLRVLPVLGLLCTKRGTGTCDSHDSYNDVFFHNC